MSHVPPITIPPENLDERLRALDSTARARVEIMLPWLLNELLARKPQPRNVATQHALRILIGIEVSGGDCTDRELVEHHCAVIHN